MSRIWHRYSARDHLSSNNELFQYFQGPLVRQMYSPLDEKDNIRMTQAVVKRMFNHQWTHYRVINKEDIIDISKIGENKDTNYKN